MSVTYAQMWWVLLLLPSVHGAVYSNAKYWAELERHPMHDIEPLTETVVSETLLRQWNYMKSICTGLPEDVEIRSFIDEDLRGTHVLAWASKSLELKNGTWYPTLHTPGYTSYDIIIAVNPDVPNGWHTRPDCRGIGYRYDLNTVMLHELLHGIGISSSMNSDYTLGYSFKSTCYPTHFDTLLEGVNGPVTSGCNYTGVPGEPLFVNGVELYHPSSFVKGSSLSHHSFPGMVMYASLPPRTCMGLGLKEVQILDALHVQCDPISTTSTAARIAPKMLVSLAWAWLAVR